MGGILTYFKGNPDKVEILEGLHKDIEKYKEVCDNIEKQKKNVVHRIRNYCILIYIMTLIYFFFYFRPIMWAEYLLLLLPMIGIPIIIWILVKLLNIYYSSKHKKGKAYLAELETKKKGILNQVKETETYTKATEILEKFDPEFQKRKLEEEMLEASKLNDTTIFNESIIGHMGKEKEKKLANEELLREMEIRRRLVAATPVRPQQRALLNSNLSATPRLQLTPAGRLLSFPTNSLLAHHRQPWDATQNPTRPMPIFKQERTFMDKFVDYLVGDGPSNRFALVCSFCRGHNGMALMEEYEFMSFYCCYCRALNPARKTKPFAPKLHTLPAILPSPEEPNPPSVPGSSEDSKEDSDTFINEDIQSEEGSVSEPTVESPPSPTPSLEGRSTSCNNGGAIITEFIDDSSSSNHLD